ncbi:transposase [Streptomyces sp. NPDC014623]|uniref:transposase n=1 Tax=Streptomyces sp. NPDC014623 TaxID=3364875 RepID=UPI0036FA4833
MDRGDPANVEWERLKPPLLCGDACGDRWIDHRRVINRVLYRVRTGVQWQDLPDRSGPWRTIRKRHHHSSVDGTWAMILSRIRGVEGAAARVGPYMSLDSTTVRAAFPP